MGGEVAEVIWGQQRPPNSLALSEMLSEMRSDMRSLKLYMMNNKATPNLSPANFGAQEMARLENANLVKVFEGVEGLSPVLREADRLDLAKMANEHQLVAFVTPFLEAVFEEKEGYSFVNSEEYPWLKTSEDKRYNQKPDLLFCHDSTYTPKEPFQTEDDVLTLVRRSTDTFGILTDWRLRNCIGMTLQAKVKVGNQGFGEVLNYGAHICFNGGPVHTRLILFDSEEFWLVDCTKGSATAVTKCYWTTPGSKKLLFDFPLENNLMKLLKRACNALNVTVQPEAFLGAGAFGFVFKAHRSGYQSQLALKLVLSGAESGDNVADLETERQYLARAKELCPQSVMGVEDSGFFSFENLGGALLLSEVGCPVPPRHSRDLIRSLARLHQKQIIHGDPRIQNVVIVGGNLRWIDFRGTKLQINGVLSMRRDMEVLLRSLGVSTGEVDACVADYDGSDEKANAVIGKLLNIRPI